MFMGRLPGVPRRPPARTTHPQPKQAMSVQIVFSGCHRLPEHEAAITKAIDGFRQNLRIDEARVRVECHAGQPYPFRVAAHLVTPGPDLEAEGRDYTFEAALRKLGQAVGKTLRQRESKRRRAAVPLIRAKGG